MTRPYTGIVVKRISPREDSYIKSPFNFFVSFSYLLSFLFLSFFALFPFSIGQKGLITQGRWVVNFRLIICQNDSIVLNKVCTIAVKTIY